MDAESYCAAGTSAVSGPCYDDMVKDANAVREREIQEKERRKP